MNIILLCIALIILSVAVLVALIGVFGMKLFIHREGKKIEVTIDHNDNSTN